MDNKFKVERWGRLNGQRYFISLLLSPYLDWPKYKENKEGWILASPDKGDKSETG